MPHSTANPPPTNLKTALWRCFSTVTNLHGIFLSQTNVSEWLFPLHPPHPPCKQLKLLSTTYSRSFPLHTPGLGRTRSELTKAQRLRGGWEIRVAEKLPLRLALAPERLVVLVQVFVGVGVGAETRGTGSLLGQSGRNSRHAWTRFSGGFRIKCAKNTVQTQKWSFKEVLGSPPSGVVSSVTQCRSSTKPILNIRTHEFTYCLRHIIYTIIPIRWFIIFCIILQKTGLFD